MAADDDALVDEREEELAAELRAEITALGEAGWLSPFYTGHPLDLTHGGADPRFCRYRDWREERDQWAQTGDRSHLDGMLAKVTWTVPPRREEVAPRVSAGVRDRPLKAWQIGLVAIGAGLFMVFLMWVAVLLFS